MRLGKSKAHFKILVYDAYKKKTKSFVFDSEDIKSNKELLELIRELLINYYEKKKIEVKKE